MDSIRTFDPETQRSLHKVDSVRMLPAREFPLDEDAGLRFRSVLRERFPIDPRRCPLYQDMKQGGAPAGIEYYLPLFFEQTATLFDYLGQDALCVLGEGALEAAEHFWTQTGERYEQRRDIERGTAAGRTVPAARTLREALNLRRRIGCWARSTTYGSRPMRWAMPHQRCRWCRGRNQRRGAARIPRQYPAGTDRSRFAGPARSPARRACPHDLKPETVADWNAFRLLSPARGRGLGGVVADTSAENPRDSMSPLP